MRNILQFGPTLFDRIEVLNGLAPMLYGSMEPGGVFYNGFARSLQGCRAGPCDTGAAIKRLVGRDLDRSRLQRLPTAA